MNKGNEGNKKVVVCMSVGWSHIIVHNLASRVREQHAKLL